MRLVMQLAIVFVPLAVIVGCGGDKKPAETGSGAYVEPTTSAAASSTAEPMTSAVKTPE